MTVDLEKVQEKHSGYKCFLIGLVVGLSVMIAIIGAIIYPQMPALNSKADELYRQIEEKAYNDTDLEFVRAAYDVLAHHITYSSDIEDPINFNSVYGSLVEGKARCLGIAEGFQKILEMRGIPSIVVHGKTHDVGHSWNVILVDDEWKVCDLTWGVGGIDAYPPGYDGYNPYLWEGYMIDQGLWLQKQEIYMYPWCYWEEDIKKTVLESL